MDLDNQSSQVALFEKWGIDAIGPLPRAANGKLYILVAIDYMTRWVEAQSVARINEKTVSKFVYTNIFSRFGTPLEIIFDNGSRFRKGLLIEVCEELNIQHRHSTPYHPQLNGLVEKTNGIIGRIIKKMVQSKPKLWDIFLDGALWAYRTTYSDATQFTPFHLVYGQEAFQPIELQIPTIKQTGELSLTSNWKLVLVDALNMTVKRQMQVDKLIVIDLSETSEDEKLGFVETTTMLVCKDVHYEVLGRLLEEDWGFVEGLHNGDSYRCKALTRGQQLRDDARPLRRSTQELRCWNCNETSHGMYHCPHPRRIPGDMYPPQRPPQTVQFDVPQQSPTILTRPPPPPQPMATVPLVPEQPEERGVNIIKLEEHEELNVMPAIKMTRAQERDEEMKSDTSYEPKKGKKKVKEDEAESSKKKKSRQPRRVIGIDDIPLGKNLEPYDMVEDLKSQ
ncbi:hypothetical protein L7F22_060478 [Adiantum nelumboides]|nr:hypothetical protein [Adiantum nelumboides]